MKISELIEKLQEFKKEYGDKRIIIAISDNPDFYELYDINNIINDENDRRDCFITGIS